MGQLQGQPDSERLSSAIRIEQLIREEDTVAMVRLIGKVAGMDASVPVRRRALMEGLAELTEADGWLWTISVNTPRDSRPSTINLIHDGLSDHQLNGIIEGSLIAGDKPPEDELLANTILDGKHFTRMRRQLVDDKTWYGHPTVRDYRLDRGLDDFLYSFYPLSEGIFSGIGLIRKKGNDYFTERQSRICHIILSNIDWLHRAGIPGHEGKTVPDLTPKQRIVLSYLIQGYKRADIARTLVISEHTVNDHTKVIYRHFNVNSQLGLIRHFTAGDGADQD